MAIPKRLTRRPRNLEELANLADAWADLSEKHRWSHDTDAYAHQTAQKLREKATHIRALLLLQTARGSH